MKTLVALERTILVDIWHMAITGTLYDEPAHSSITDYILIAPGSARSANSAPWATTSPSPHLGQPLARESSRQRALPPRDPNHRPSFHRLGALLWRCWNRRGS